MLNLRSRFVRLALVMAIVPAIIMAAVGGFAVHQFDRQLTAELKTQINEDIASLVEIYSVQGADALILSVNMRSKLTPSNGAVPSYSLTQAALPSDKSLGADRLLKSAYVLEGNTLTRQTVLKNGEILSVGRSLDAKTQAISHLSVVFLGSVVLCVILGLLVGLVAAELFRRRLRQINTLCYQVAQGDVTARLRPDASGDEISHLSENINAMLSRIQKLMLARKRVSDSVAHELRTPLTQLDGTLYRAEQAASDAVPIIAARKDLKDCVALLDALLDVSALEAQSDDKSGFEVFDMAQTARDICEFYDALASEKHQTLSCDAPKSCLIKGDPMQIGRLIANLVDNAIKYTPEYGKIIVSAETLSDAVLLSVRDSGAGIAKENQAEVFMPFYRNQTSENCSEASSGHGFGLALVKAIADRHEAVISISSTPEIDGTKFTLRLPKTV